MHRHALQPGLLEQGQNGFSFHLWLDPSHKALHPVLSRRLQLTCVFSLGCLWSTPSTFSFSPFLQAPSNRVARLLPVFPQYGSSHDRGDSPIHRPNLPPVVLRFQRLLTPHDLGSGEQEPLAYPDLN